MCCRGEDAMQSRNVANRHRQVTSSKTGVHL
jgi:hypothetical protein